VTPVSRRTLLSFGLALAGGLTGRSAYADAAVEEALAKVSRARASLKTLTGPFTQERTIGLLATKVASKGRLALVLPDRLVWELAEPDAISYWVGPEGLAYKGRRGQGRLPVTERIAPALEDLRTLLGGDLARLAVRHDVTLLPEPPGGGVGFAMVPKAGTPIRFKRIELELGPDLLRPRRVALVEGAKDRTDIVFGELVRDAPVDPARVRPP
jgi:hypothetical protein